MTVENLNDLMKLIQDEIKATKSLINDLWGDWAGNTIDDASDNQEMLTLYGRLKYIERKINNLEINMYVGVGNDGDLPQMVNNLSDARDKGFTQVVEYTLSDGEYVQKTVWELLGGIWCEKDKPFYPATKGEQSA